MAKKTAKAAKGGGRGKRKDRGGSAERAPARPATEGATARDVIRVPTDNQVRNAVKHVAQLKATASSTAGEVGSAVSNLEKSQHFDPWALRTVTMMQKLSKDRRDKFAIRWTHLLKYAAALQFDELASLQDEMFDEGETGPNDDPGERDLRPDHLRQGSAEPGKVVPMPARQTAESSEADDSQRAAGLAGSKMAQ